MTIIADKMVCGGDCITKIDGKTVFVPGILPGEEASVKIVESRKDFDRAEVLAITKCSPHRRTAPCSCYGICGGCNLQMADDDYQRELRLSILKDCFRRGFGRTLSTFPEVERSINEADILFGSSWGYRSRFQFHSDGLKKRSDDSIVAIDTCPVATDAVNTILKEKKLPVGSDRTHVFEDMIASQDTENAEYTVTVNGKKLLFNIRGFFQSNLEMISKTIRLIETEMKKRVVPSEKTVMLDMYCGVGTFTKYLGPLFGKSVLVEHNSHAIQYADKNVAEIPHASYAMSGARWIRTPEAKNCYDAVVIDPPRSGMEKEVCSWLCSNKTPLICSVSCDPVTHARDAARLVQSGYKLEKLTLLDFYPQTSHIESFALFTYK